MLIVEAVKGTKEESRAYLAIIEFDGLEGDINNLNVKNSVQLYQLVH